MSEASIAKDQENPELWQRYSEDRDLHERSRKKVLELADFIVPGHGDMFEVVKRPVRPKNESSDASPGLRSKLIWFVAIPFAILVAGGLAIWAITAQLA